jgi:hypothetical protein
MKQDPETKEMIDELLKDFKPSTQKAYLINLFTYPDYTDKTVREILVSELTAREETERLLNRYKKGD